MNRAILVGRLTKNPESRYSQSGTCVSRYTLAVDRAYKKDGEPSADFINCIAFGKQGEFAEKYLSKGSKILVEGEIRTGSYEKDGHKVYTTDVVVNRHEFVAAKAAVEDKPSDDFMAIPDDIDELPFG